MPEEGVNPIDTPFELLHVWGWFCEMTASRQQGMNGPQRLSNQEMLAYFTLERIELEGWETRVLRLLDAAALKKYNDGAQG